jgi:hypothetical protein
MNRSNLLVVLVLAGCGGGNPSDSGVFLLAAPPGADIEFAVVRYHEAPVDIAAASRAHPDSDATPNRLVFGYLPAEAAERSF